MTQPADGAQTNELPEDWWTGAEPATQHSYFGTCPTCEQTDGHINIGRVHWGYCAEHKICWVIGSNLFSGWKYETEDQQRAIYDKLDFGTFTRV